MSNIQEVLDTQQRIEGNLLSKLAEFEKKLQAAVPDSKPSLEKLSQDFYDYKKLVCSMLNALHSQIHLLTSQMDILDNQQRLNALLFSGVQESETEDCIGTITNIITNKLNLQDFHKSSIYACHRLGMKAANRNRPIVVRFTDINIRNKVWREKKLLKSSAIVISEFLTKLRQTLFVTARKHFGMTRCWTEDGNIFVKVSDKDRRRVGSAQELDLLIQKYPAISSNTKDGGATKETSHKQLSATVASNEPPMTRRNAAAKGRFAK